VSARRFVLCLVAAAVLGGVLGRATTSLAPDPDPLVCAHIWAALNDPESQQSRTPGELEQAWDDEGCAEVGK
jgi:hypothetical protein